MNNLALLNLNFKKFGAVFLFLLPLALYTQKNDQENQKPDYYYDVLGQVKIGFLVPSAYGNNFISEGYDTWNGVHIDAQIKLRERLLLGLQYQAFKGRVTDQELVGPIDASGITHFFATFGYALLEKRNNFQIEGNVGFGGVTLRNENGFRRFNDNGFAIMANVNFSYRLNYWLGFYLSVQNNWDFWSIERPSELDDIFGKTSFFMPSLGVKFYIL
ncbi:hypothetical protein MTsPCn9_14740 [Croceitalea sp. MTPC9]|uniref:hypothetical protein n=1 Tax=unclassified Croceitalea TaxID=2632280 RepID=UPI002B391A40|nr:hypothetical protein MTsPCn6_14390 [Croceitalea sp. MTPC6]GMN16538.1 hypothetical protein MTsPCn9_14740 [Croceitalea sp. MTPC9]